MKRAGENLDFAFSALHDVMHSSIGFSGEFLMIMDANLCKQ